jgi:PAS domain S-box-containing protein
MPIPVHSMGPDGRIVAVNDAWVEYTGYGEAAAIGRSFAEFLDGPSASLYRHNAVPELINTVPARESRSVEYRLIKQSGEFADIVLTARPERDSVSGRFLHSLAVVIDITARNRAEAALRQAQKMEALGGLTSGVAHDFNNLLTIILSSLQLLTKRLPREDARAARLLDVALQGVQRGAALTSRLLAFSRQQDLSPRSVDPRDLLGSLRPMLGHLLGPAISVEEEFPPDLWNLRADRTQLELAILNIAANARDAMPDGGRLLVTARNVTIVANDSAFIDHATRSNLPAGQYVVLSIIDNGTGMDEVALARAADPFFTTKGLGKGTGLGLSMVHGFMVQSGGALLLSSRIGEGTRVDLWLPRTAEPAAEAGDLPTLRGDGAGPRGLRVLLVDDDPLVLAATTGMLEELGHEAAGTAASGAEALGLLRSEASFDLLLTDLMMPGMSGMQLAAQAKALYPALPIVLASGFAELDRAATAEWPRLRKPYDLRDLAAALAGILADASARR